MERDLFARLQGKEVQVVFYSVDCENGQANFNVRLGDDIVKLIFENVSELSITRFSPPFIIQGFEIIDNKERGWQKDHRYTIHDYEDEKINFFCENISEA